MAGEVVLCRSKLKVEARGKGDRCKFLGNMTTANEHKAYPLFTLGLFFFFLSMHNIGAGNNLIQLDILAGTPRSEPHERFPF